MTFFRVKMRTFGLAESTLDWKSSNKFGFLLTYSYLCSMNDFLYINHANDYALDVGAEVFHPMVSVVHFDELGEIRHSLNKLGVYSIFVQDNFPVGSSYGMGGYDTTKGSLTAAAPGQVIGKADDGHREVYHGWALLFDAEFMRGTTFEERLADYHFFSYKSAASSAIADRHP